MSAGPKVEVEIQRKTETPNGMGGFVITWYGFKKLKGTLLALRARERNTNNGTKVYSDHYFQCPFPRGVEITEEDRLLYLGDVYEITFSDDLTKRGVTLILELKKVK
jgi:head-tail adaptor